MGQYDLETTPINYKYREPHEFAGFNVSFAKRPVPAKKEEAVSKTDTSRSILDQAAIILPLPVKGFHAFLHTIGEFPNQVEFIYEFYRADGSDTELKRNDFGRESMLDSDVKIQEGVVFWYGGISPKGHLFIEEVDETTMRPFLESKVEEFVRDYWEGFPESD